MAIMMMMMRDDVWCMMCNGDEVWFCMLMHDDDIDDDDAWR